MTKISEDTHPQQLSILPDVGLIHSSVSCSQCTTQQMVRLTKSTQVTNPWSWPVFNKTGFKYGPQIVVVVFFSPSGVNHKEDRCFCFSWLHLDSTASLLSTENPWVWNNAWCIYCCLSYEIKMSVIKTANGMLIHGEDREDPLSKDLSIVTQASYF